ncbi:hypothetical protein [Pedobacter sp. UBA5917]|jgi:hypothetical protein|uniref:hypothetical protein n=1 Tax=Pedobacter sp. UBA5917 TaxID=1947061 RepID=UPI0025CCF827|nr:hypothetical protein [Pedobacter sp. UBA5917]
METLRKIQLLLVMLTIAACKKPTENIKIVIDTDVIKYTALINVTDGQNGSAAPAGTTIAITGAAANDIYELSGKKDIKLSSGIVTIGLKPTVAPAVNEPITINAEINAPGYNKETRQVTFRTETKQQVVNIQLTRTGSTAPPIVTPPPPVFNNVSLTFTGRCPNRTDIEVRPSVYVYFKKSGSNAAFQYLGYMDKGNISTNLLQQGETYDFQIVYGAETYKVSQRIDQTSYNLTLDMPAACNF